MEKFMIRFFSTFQFICPGLIIVLLTWWLGYHLLHGSLNWFCGIMFGIMEVIVVSLTITAFKEMREDYKNTSNENKIDQ